MGLLSPGAESLLSASDADVHTSVVGRTLIWRPARGVLVVRCERTFSRSHALSVDLAMRRVVADDGRLLMLNDWEEMTDYDTATRVHLTQVANELRPSLEGVHILLRSRVVALGVQAANLVMKILQVYTERAPFEAVVRAAIQRGAK